MKKQKRKLVLHLKDNRKIVGQLSKFFKKIQIMYNIVCICSAIAHCYEMNGKFDEGIEFMESTVKNWEPCFILACHNFWHNSLMYIEKGNYEAALTLFDQEIYKRSKSNQMLDIVDAASLLSRLEMEGLFRFFVRLL